MDYVAWKNMQKCIPPTSNLHVRIKKFQSYGNRVRHSLCHMEEYPKMDRAPHQIVMWDTTQKFESYGYRVRN